ncbi:hypothetical protein C8F04DRAFT_1177902 [Mycena alexandri]|uniref:Uncharacterized protein n=1 Tax=Mycena alexandri TaxID=1745969 RepID=A0AAD6T7N4_9AGAR|nr:hypothetical protein C8F04DRAFT_1177902 [Mycena alexandri]
MAKPTFYLLAFILLAAGTTSSFINVPGCLPDEVGTIVSDRQAPQFQLTSMARDPKKRQSTQPIAAPSPVPNPRETSQNSKTAVTSSSLVTDIGYGLQHRGRMPAAIEEGFIGSVHSPVRPAVQKWDVRIVDSAFLQDPADAPADPVRTLINYRPLSELFLVVSSRHCFLTGPRRNTPSPSP